MDSEDEEALENFSKITDTDANSTARELKNRLRGLKAGHNLLKQHGNAVHRTIVSFKPGMRNDEDQLAEYLQTLTDRAMLFGIAAQAMLELSTNYMLSVENDSHQVFKMLQYERQRVKALEKTLYEAAKQHTKLERKTRKYTTFSRYAHTDRAQSIKSTDDDENSTLLGYSTKSDEQTEIESLHDDLSDIDSLRIIRKSVYLSRKTRKASISVEPVSSTISRTVGLARRSRVPNRPSISTNAWSILKNSIGKDLSKIPLPVNFNEPLSLLQRLTEELEYAELLNTAANIADRCEQLAYVAAFSISSYATASNRTNKPFNPLLSETYEYDRTEDLGWRSIAEQVSQHPPIAALFCEGRGWKLWEESLVKMKFKGKNLQIVSLGQRFVEFTRSGNVYKWNKVTTIVNNIIIGKTWLDLQGDVEIVGLSAAAGISCTLTYVPFSMFSRDRQRLVKGEVRNESNQVAFIVQAYWDSHAEIAKVTDGKPLQKDFIRIWERCLPEPGSEKYHHFSRFTSTLNELEDGIAPTDSRLRPDLRLMEEGHWDESNAAKLKLEEKQRLKRKRQSEENKAAKRSSDWIEPHDPMWFERTIEIDKVVHVYNGGYWDAKSKQDWSSCPKIFDIDNN